jgi:N-methylhydantoinase B
MASAAASLPGSPSLDPIELAVMANRMEAIVREMTSTVVRTARSSVIALARDMSCCVTTPDGELIAAADSLPVHIYGATLQAKAMLRRHPEFKEGDAFLHNDPYDGGTHPADHSIIVPVFHEGVHVGTVIVMCHQADVGNALPTTYMAAARDVYEEGALIFPCVRVQENYQDNCDIINMCRRRIRVPEIWYGDYLAASGAARVGERRLKDFVAKYGVDTMGAFVTEWFDYSERVTIDAIRKYPSGSVTCKVRHDPVDPVLPEGLELTATYTIDAEAGYITVDQRDNPDCLDAGLNMTEATAYIGTAQGVLNCLTDVPYNSGTLRRIRILLRENCCVGIPVHPHSCSCATAPTVDLLVNMAQFAMAQLGEGGMAEGNWSNSAGAASLSGEDPRKGKPFVDQMFLMGGGGPATAVSDGMAYYLIPPGAGLLYRDSVEVNELRFPILVNFLRTKPDTAGAGYRRGGPATEVQYGPRFADLTVINITNGREAVPRGVRGGHDAGNGLNLVIRSNTTREVQGAFMQALLHSGDVVRGTDQGGGGFGDPLDREPDRVVRDVEDRLICAHTAEAVYGVVLIGSLDDDDLRHDSQATQQKRAQLRLGIQKLS